MDYNTNSIAASEITPPPQHNTLQPPPQQQSQQSQQSQHSQHSQQQHLFQHIKRRNDDFESNQHRFKNMTHEEAINSTTEWPQFIHPDGGIVKISPWGSIREYTDPKTNQTVTKFEDCNFDDYSFRSESVEKIYQTPDTPQSLHNQSGSVATSSGGAGAGAGAVAVAGGDSGANPFTLSPSNEVEGYVVDGYGQYRKDAYSRANDQYPVEQENYFGIGGEQMEEFDCSYNEDEDEQMK
ncbi:hypothetical protein KGF57_000883 [Candida theae]|uniref:Uncharacterized protein n=1 Tax=Candida theae TaxID=1198502 RepID=A0AAD5BI53_9ASCO|nr:uncharacterized protein KGF57_000883 [Candida theae]KAI5965090.1 hypothetical protein KGF57_000883 [Candida theae]